MVRQVEAKNMSKLITYKPINCKSRANIATRMRHARPGARFPQDTRLIPRELIGQGVKFNIQFQLVPTLRISGAVLLCHLYTLKSKAGATSILFTNTSAILKFPGSRSLE
jgi:hypothetical protein